MAKDLDSKYLNMRDMFDGGGAGKSGQRFEGGGVISDLGNLLFDPVGSRRAQFQHAMAPVATAPAAVPVAVVQAPVAAQRQPVTNRPVEAKTVLLRSSDSNRVPAQNPNPNTPPTVYSEAPVLRQAPVGSRLSVTPRPNVQTEPPVLGRPPAGNKLKVTQNGPPLSFEDFLGGLGDLRFKESPEALKTAYDQFIQGYGQ